jgi:hypothetical protein
VNSTASLPPEPVNGVPAVRPTSSSSRSAPVTTIRWSNRDRESSSDRPTSAIRSDGRASTKDLRRIAWSRSASSVRAESTHGTTDGPAAGAVTGAGGASSMITCALVPLMPNDDTPARRVAVPPRHVVGSVNRVIAPADQLTFRVGSPTCSVLGSIPLRSAITILMTPPTPAAACAWPMLDFSEPSHSGRSRSCP